jgi:N-acetylmuramoyl-L-alanine amidase
MRGFGWLGGRMKVVAIAAGLLLSGLLAGAVTQAAAEAASGVLKVRLGGDSAETRLVVDLDRSVTAKLVADGSRDGRIVIAFPKMSVPAELRGAGQGVVRRWTLARKGGASELTIELAGKAEVSRRFLLPPADGVPHYRYVIDLKSNGVVAAGRAPAPPPRPTTVRAERRTGKKVIVIDAGHGGHDPGALGKIAKEKDITLAAAKSLKARLERTGRYTVILTRDRDVYIHPTERPRIARRAEADLFISLHADAGPADVSGASVYTLSEKGESRVASMLHKDDWFLNASLTGGDKSVGQILLDLTQRSTRNRSAMFAELLVSEICEVSPMLRRSHRDANLAVLLAPDVPAVLLEMGFITSPEDEKFLTSAAGRGRLMDRVGDAIDRWFDREARIASRG